MRKGLSLLLVGIALLLLGGWLTLWLTAPKHRITKANIERIQQGMTQEEVETLLGVPPGDYSGGQPAEVFYFGSSLLGGAQWIGDEAAVRIWFDRDGKVFDFQRGLVDRGTDASLLDKLRRWLGL